MILLRPELRIVVVRSHRAYIVTCLRLPDNTVSQIISFSSGKLTPIPFEIPN